MSDINFKAAHEAISKFCSRKYSLNVPPQDSDPDIVLSKVLKQAEKALTDNALALKIYEKIKDRIPPNVEPCYDHITDYDGEACIFFSHYHKDSVIKCNTCWLFDRYVGEDLPNMCEQLFRGINNEENK